MSLSLKRKMSASDAVARLIAKHKMYSQEIPRSTECAGEIQKYIKHTNLPERESSSKRRKKFRFPIPKRAKFHVNHEGRLFLTVYSSPLEDRKNIKRKFFGEVPMFVRALMRTDPKLHWLVKNGVLSISSANKANANTNVTTVMPYRSEIDSNDPRLVTSRLVREFAQRYADHHNFSELKAETKACNTLNMKELFCDRIPDLFSDDLESSKDVISNKNCPRTSENVNPVDFLELSLNESGQDGRDEKEDDSGIVGLQLKVRKNSDETVTVLDMSSSIKDLNRRPDPENPSSLIDIFECSCCPSRFTKRIGLKDHYAKRHSIQLSDNDPLYAYSSEGWKTARLLPDGHGA